MFVTRSSISSRVLSCGFVLLVAGAFSVAGAVSDRASWAGDALAPSITPAELEARLAGPTAPIVIDVRTPAEYATGHIPGAVNIPYDEVAKRISEVDAPHGVALYCMKGPRARMGEAALLASGYEPVLHLEGGFMEWEAAGLPVEPKH